jgi:hypothetical protein
MDDELLPLGETAMPSGIATSALRSGMSAGCPRRTEDGVPAVPAVEGETGSIERVF